MRRFQFSELDVNTTGHFSLELDDRHFSLEENQKWFGTETKLWIFGPHRPGKEEIPTEYSRYTYKTIVHKQIHQLEQNILPFGMLALFIATMYGSIH
ncbi:MAG: hypothetical protein EOP45_06125 [Sphingobacteriaceae bacterium]|nr:MAG: hypothetical protein EOP45_06125 [Sphingobacteriaceae bacterium]